MSLHGWGRGELGFTAKGRHKERWAGFSTTAKKQKSSGWKLCLPVVPFLNSITDWIVGGCFVLSADTCLLFITGPGSRHNCGINATQIILLFHKVFIMNHSQIHLIRKIILFTYMFCNYLVTPLCQKESKKKKKKSKMCTSSNLQCSLTVEL